MQRQRDHDEQASTGSPARGLGSSDRVPSPPQAAAVPGRRKGFRFIGTAVAVGLVTAAAVLLLPQKPAGDAGLTQAAKDQRIQAYQKEGVFHLPAVTSAETRIALDGMGLPPASRDALQKDIDAGRTSLAWLTVWDDLEEDGDTVALSGAGFARVVVLTHVKQRIAIPLSANGTLRLQGVRDGGGGITVAAEANGHAIPLPVMDIGQAFDIRVGPAP